MRKHRLGRHDARSLPPTELGLDEPRRFHPVGLARRHWSNATAIRKIFRDAFASVQLPYANPHSFRNTLVELAYKLQLPPEDFKVWSQNLGHESILTTFSSYGPVTFYRQAEIMRNLGHASAPATDTDGILSQIAALTMRRQR